MDSLLEKWRLFIFRKPQTISSKIFRSIRRKRYAPYYFTNLKARASAKLYKFRKKVIKSRRRKLKKKLLYRKKLFFKKYRPKRWLSLPVVKGTAKCRKIYKNQNTKKYLKTRAKNNVLLKKPYVKKTRVFPYKQQFPNYITGFKLTLKTRVRKRKQIRIFNRKQRLNLVAMSKLVRNKYKLLAHTIKQNVSKNKRKANVITRKTLLQKIKRHSLKFKKHYLSSMLTIFFKKARKQKYRFAIKHYKNIIRKKKRLWRRKLRNEKLKLQSLQQKSFRDKLDRNKKKKKAIKLLLFPVSFYQFLLQSTPPIILPPTSKYFKLLKILIIMFRSILQASFKKQIFYLTLFRQSLMSILRLPAIIPKFFMLRIITLLLLKEFSFKHTNIYYFQKVISSRYFIFQGAHLAIASSVASLDNNKNMRISFFGMHIGNLTAALTCNFIIYKLGQYFTIQEIFRLLLRDIKHSPNLTGFRIVVAGVSRVKNVLHI